LKGGTFSFSPSFTPPLQNGSANFKKMPKIFKKLILAVQRHRIPPAKKTDNPKANTKKANTD